MEDLTTLIEDSITDAELPSSPDTSSDPVEASPEPDPVEPVAEAVPAVDAPVEPARPAQDDFDKKFGLAAQSSSGRENRIPYSRVKKITEKAVNDAKSDWEKTVQSGFVPAAKFTAVEQENKVFREQFAQVAEFEKVMLTDHTRFLQMLYKQPGYREIFDQLATAAQRPQAQAAEPVPAPVVDDFPQPDQELSDGSKVYSMEGLKALREWDRKQVAASVLKEVEQRYAPLEQDYKAHQQIQQILPKVQQQIDDARTWPLFNENEPEIVKALQLDSRLSLEKAYQTVVFPKMRAEQQRVVNESKVSRESIRAEILKELKQAPRATSATASPSRPAAPTSAGPRSMEDIIADSLKGLR